MRATLRAVVFAMLAFSVGLWAADDPLMGTWKLNVSKSQLGPRPRSNYTRKHEPVPNGMKVIWEGIDADGKPAKWEFTAKFDGKDYPVKGDPAFDTLSLKRLNRYTIEGSSKKDGKLAVTFRWEASKDGKTLTRTAKRMRPPEQAGITIEIFDKQL